MPSSLFATPHDLVSINKQKSTKLGGAKRKTIASYGYWINNGLGFVRYDNALEAKEIKAATLEEAQTKLENILKNEISAQKQQEGFAVGLTRRNKGKSKIKRFTLYLYQFKDGILDKPPLPAITNVSEDAIAGRLAAAFHTDEEKSTVTANLNDTAQKLSAIDNILQNNDSLNTNDSLSNSEFSELVSVTEQTVAESAEAIAQVANGPSDPAASTESLNNARQDLASISQQIREQASQSNPNGPPDSKLLEEFKVVEAEAKDIVAQNIQAINNGGIEMRVFKKFDDRWYYQKNNIWAADARTAAQQVWENDSSPEDMPLQRIAVAWQPTETQTNSIFVIFYDIREDILFRLNPEVLQFDEQDWHGSNTVAAAEQELLQNEETQERYLIDFNGDEEAYFRYFQSNFISEDGKNWIEAPIKFDFGISGLGPKPAAKKLIEWGLDEGYTHVKFVCFVLPNSKDPENPDLFLLLTFVPVRNDVIGKALTKIQIPNSNIRITNLQVGSIFMDKYSNLLKEVNNNEQPLKTFLQFYEKPQTQSNQWIFRGRVEAENENAAIQNLSNFFNHSNTNDSKTVPKHFIIAQVLSATQYKYKIWLHGLSAVGVHKTMPELKTATAIYLQPFDVDMAKEFFISWRGPQELKKKPAQNPVKPIITSSAQKKSEKAAHQLAADALQQNSLEKKKSSEKPKTTTKTKPKPKPKAKPAPKQKAATSKKQEKDDEEELRIQQMIAAVINQARRIIKSR
jgi:hypothetical protein